MDSDRARRMPAAVAAVLAALAAGADTPRAGVAVVPPAALVWRADPALAAGISVALVVGNPSLPGPYALRVRLPAGARVPPHTHPDPRLVTVLGGDYGFGLGAPADPGAVEHLPAGSVILVPAGVVHYSLAFDTGVELQESGVGPSGASFVEPAAAGRTPP